MKLGVTSPRPIVMSSAPAPMISGQTYTSIPTRASARSTSMGHVALQQNPRMAVANRSISMSQKPQPVHAQAAPSPVRITSPMQGTVSQNHIGTNRAMHTNSFSSVLSSAGGQTTPRMSSSASQIPVYQQTQRGHSLSFTTSSKGFMTHPPQANQQASTARSLPVQGLPTNAYSTPSRSVSINPYQLQSPAQGHKPYSSQAQQHQTIVHNTVSTPRGVHTPQKPTIPPSNITNPRPVANQNYTKERSTHPLISKKSSYVRVYVGSPESQKTGLSAMMSPRSHPGNALGTPQKKVFPVGYSMAPISSPRIPPVSNIKVSSQSNETNPSLNTHASFRAISVVSSQPAMVTLSSESAAERNKEELSPPKPFLCTQSSIATFDSKNTDEKNTSIDSESDAVDILLDDSAIDSSVPEPTEAGKNDSALNEAPDKSSTRGDFCSADNTLTSTESPIQEEHQGDIAPEQKSSASKVFENEMPHITENRQTPINQDSDQKISAKEQELGANTYEDETDETVAPSNADAAQNSEENDEAVEPARRKTIVSYHIGDYHIRDTIGIGGCAIVQLALHEPSGVHVAMKTFAKTKEHSDGRHVASWDEIKQEIKMLQYLEHPNIVRMYEIFQTSEEIYMTLDFCPHADLYSYSVAHGLPVEFQLRKWFCQMLYAVEYCHSMRILHRDLKAENFLLDEYYNIKLSDFGLSVHMEEGAKVISKFLSLPYCSPEMLHHREYSGFGADIWSLGILLYFLTTGYFPFRNEDEVQLYDDIESGIFSCPEDFPPELEDMVRKMLQVDVSSRYTLAEIRQHPWMTQIVMEPPFKRTSSVKIDIDVAHDMESRGVKIDDLVTNIREKSFNPVYATYFLKKRAKDIMAEIAALQTAESS